MFQFILLDSFHVVEIEFILIWQNAIIYFNLLLTGKWMLMLHQKLKYLWQFYTTEKLIKTAAKFEYELDFPLSQNITFFQYFCLFSKYDKKIWFVHI